MNMTVPVMKNEESLKSEIEKYKSIKADVIETDSIKSENIKMESGCNTGDYEEKDTKHFAHKGIELDGTWKHVEVELLPQTTH